MIVAAVVIASVSLVVIAIGLMVIRSALHVIHDAVNSNMTRALDEITQLHKDVARLIRERQERWVDDVINKRKITKKPTRKPTRKRR